MLKELFPGKWTSRQSLAKHVGASDKVLLSAAVVLM